jgi:hypothetical protein
MEAGFTPRIVGFLCNWCSYAGADLAGATKLEVPASLSVIRVMCSGRVDPVLAATALLHGADGVLIAGCHPGDCHYREGNYCPPEEDIRNPGAGPGPVHAGLGFGLGRAEIRGGNQPVRPAD